VTLVELLTAQANEIVKDVLHGVERSQLPLYRSSGTEQTRQRVKALFVLTARAIKERNLGPILAYAEEVGRERYSSGVDLAEVQIAFNVLEEVLWHRILTSVPPVYFAESLGLVGTVLSSGKDMLARTYVTLAARTKSPSLHLEGLFDGSEGS
jgi:hypothetical protein